MPGEIIVGVDESDGARRALAWAVAEARRRDGTVTAVHVQTPLPALLAEIGLTDDEQERVERTLWVRAGGVVEDAIASVDHDGVTVKGETIADPSVVRGLVERAGDASALVLGRRGRGNFARLRLGSVTRQAVHHADCPVVVVPASAPRRTEARVVVGTDGSQPALAALRRAAQEARLRGATLEVVVVQPPPPPAEQPAAAETTALAGAMWIGLTPLRTTMSEAERREHHQHVLAVWRAAADRMLDDALAELDDDERPEQISRAVVADQQPARTLLGIAETSELLVVGARGLGGFTGLLLGSVSQQCIQHARCPVMVVRGAG